MSASLTNWPVAPTSNNDYNDHLENNLTDSFNMTGPMERIDHDPYQNNNQSYTQDFKPTFYNPFEVKHRRRTTRAQFKVLEKTFQENPKPSATIRRLLAQRLNMTPRGVQVWFQNRRAKAKLQSQQDRRGSESSVITRNEECTNVNTTWGQEDSKNSPPSLAYDMQRFSSFSSDSSTQSVHPSYAPSETYSPSIKNYYAGHPRMMQKKYEPVQFMSNESFQGYQFQDHPHLRTAYSALQEEMPQTAMLRRNSCPANLISNMLPMQMLQQCQVPKSSGNNFLTSPNMPSKVRRWSSINADAIAEQEQLSYMTSIAPSESFATPSSVGSTLSRWDVDSASSVSSSPSSSLRFPMTNGEASPVEERMAPSSLPMGFSDTPDSLKLQMSQLQCAIDTFSV
ncbi:hypothetical protein INT43_006037 [Umbelopsis isabellina]|uniref:Homeobox domain-containing protein n=1 Tax=Mortierella isabellina TaxID=91625 RepID=A0A8H7PJQ5_MORIS|nr:hypothetical protein INT43_006037 [Umbelopsis isabellina]